MSGLRQRHLGAALRYVDERHPISALHRDLSDDGLGHSCRNFSLALLLNLVVSAVFTATIVDSSEYCIRMRTCHNDCRMQRVEFDECLPLDFRLRVTARPPSNSTDDGGGGDGGGVAPSPTPGPPGGNTSLPSDPAQTPNATASGAATRRGDAGDPTADRGDDGHLYRGWYRYARRSMTSPTWTECEATVTYLDWASELFAPGITCVPECGLATRYADSGFVLEPSGEDYSELCGALDTGLLCLLPDLFQRCTRLLLLEMLVTVFATAVLVMAVAHLVLERATFQMPPLYASHMMFLSFTFLLWGISRVPWSSVHFFYLFAHFLFSWCAYQAVLFPGVHIAIYFLKVATGHVE